MQLVKKDTRWGCLPAAFATVTDSTLEEIYDFCGHDGSEIVWPQLYDPLRRRSFHIQEMTSFCLSKNFSVTTIARRFCCTQDLAPDEILVFDNDITNARFHDYLQHYYGVLIGEGHAVAWDGHDILDPDGDIKHSYQFDYFFIVAKLL